MWNEFDFFNRVLSERKFDFSSVFLDFRSTYFLRN